jgi:hypothetical protein
MVATGVEQIMTFCRNALLVFAAALLFVPLAAAGGSYNFGTMQGNKLIPVEPGKTAESKLYLFNVHGDRDTHVSIGVVEAPPGFKVEIEPTPHPAVYNVTGVIINTTESLVAPVTPIETLPKVRPDENSTPPGIEYITLGGIEGFVPAKVLTIRVTAPADAPLWQDYGLKLSATAGWFDVGESGPVAVRQARDFNYGIRTITKQYTEKAVPSPVATTLPIVTPKPQMIPQLDAWMLSTLAFAIIIILLVAYVLSLRSKSKKK